MCSVELRDFQSVTEGNLRANGEGLRACPQHLILIFADWVCNGWTITSNRGVSAGPILQQVLMTMLNWVYLTNLNVQPLWLQPGL